MTTKQFLKRHVEGYLFKDLRTMQKVKLKKGQRIGGVGYPLAATILSGMELLGCLLSPTTFVITDKTLGNTYFNNFWDKYLSVKFPEYKNYGQAFRQLIRNGISHNFLTKTGVWIVKGKSSEHLTIFTEKGNHYLVVDIRKLFKDFEHCYFDYIKPMVYSNPALMTSMQSRINEIISEYEAQSNKILSKIPSPKRTNTANLYPLISNSSVVPGTIGTVTTYSGTVVKLP